MATFKLTRRRVALGAALGLAGLSIVPLVVTRVENRQAGETAGLPPHDSNLGSSAQRTADGPLRRLAIAAFLFAVLTGLLLFSVRPGDYLVNSAFLTKQSVLLLAGGNALLFQHIRGPEVRRFQAGLSLTLWLVVLFAGRWIGFIQ